MHAGNVSLLKWCKCERVSVLQNLATCGCCSQVTLQWLTVVLCSETLTPLSLPHGLATCLQGLWKRWCFPSMQTDCMERCWQTALFWWTKLAATAYLSGKSSVRCLCAHADARAHLNVHNFALKDSLTSHEVGEKAPPPLCAPHCFSDIMWHFIRK